MSVGRKTINRHRFIWWCNNRRLELWLGIHLMSLDISSVLPRNWRVERSPRAMTDDTWEQEPFTDRHTPLLCTSYWLDTAADQGDLIYYDTRVSSWKTYLNLIVCVNDNRTENFLHFLHVFTLLVFILDTAKVSVRGVCQQQTAIISPHFLFSFGFLMLGCKCEEMWMLMPRLWCHAYDGAMFSSCVCGLHHFYFSLLACKQLIISTTKKGFSRT